MSSNLKDKVVWLTGASSGIGEAMTYELIRHECQLIISARREEELERVRTNCPEGLRNNVQVLRLDLEDAESLKERTEAAISIHGRVDILINNGGISQRDLVINTGLGVDRRLMEVNYFGSIALSKYLLPKMVERKQGHHVVVTSGVGIISTPYRSGYAAAKHALHGFYDALRAEHHDDNIAVTLVCPGFVKTNISYNALIGEGEVQNKMDEAQKNGMSAEKFARKAVRAIVHKKEEVYIGGVKEIFAIYVKRFFPSVFSFLIRKMKVT